MTSSKCQKKISADLECSSFHKGSLNKHIFSLAMTKFIIRTTPKKMLTSILQAKENDSQWKSGDNRKC